MLLIAFRECHCGKRAAFSSRRSREANCVWEGRGGLWETGLFGFPWVDPCFPCAIRARAGAEPMTGLPVHIQKCNPNFNNAIPFPPLGSPPITPLTHSNPSLRARSWPRGGRLPGPRCVGSNGAGETAGVERIKSVGSRRADALAEA